MTFPSLILGIESSCDEMAAAVVRGDREVLSSVIHEQADVHQPYGGVVPELASRDHVRVISRVVARALDDAGIGLKAIEGIAATAGPGLVGSLLVGLSFGKALAYRLGVPFAGVHHLAGHIASAELGEEDLDLPCLGLVVSGGHTALYRFERSGEIALLGQTRDDAVGEAFDKVAKLLGLPYPGGPALARVAVRGNRRAVDFPRPMAKREGLDFSYSGLKTSVAIEVERRGALGERDVMDLAASFEAAAVDSLVARACKALEQEGLKTLIVVGGVSANAHLREKMAEAGSANGFRVIFPPPSLCTDNAAMVAAAGARLFRQGRRDGLEIDAFSRSPLERIPPRPGARG